MNYDIVKTGSAGNCTIIERFLAVDMGVPLKLIKPYLKSLKIVFITHIHS